LTSAIVILARIRSIGGLTTLTSCSNDDNGIAEPVGQVLQNGEWTGTGEGRSGTIVVKLVVKNHQVEQATVVSQSESVFAQETINNLVAKALGRTDMMSVEVDGILGGNTNYSTGGINAAETDIKKGLGIEDTKQLFYDDTMRGGKNETHLILTIFSE